MKSSTGRKRVASARSVRSYVLCVKNDGYPVSLDRGKLYRCLPDAPAEQHAMRRIIDESGEDYLYPRDWFIDVHLPPAAKRALSSISVDRAPTT
jgi:hypothetical protein